MSLILEALRKSEAQRRLGQAPDLHSPVVATAPRSRVPRWLLPALALMLVGAGAWWLGRMAVPDPSNGTATEAVVDPVALPLEVGEGLATGRGDTGLDASRATAAPDRPAAAPASPPRPAPRPVPAPVPAPATSAVEPTRTPVAAAEPDPASVAPPAPRASEATPVIATPPVQAAQPAPEAVPPTTAPAADDDEGLLRLADLPAATRAALPELRISMHVFAEDPSRRFAIIDGRRIGEGGLLEGQGVVEAIRRDGIVVDFDGRRVLLPRP